MEDLLKQFPESVRLKGALNLPPAMDEMTLQRHLSELATANTGAGKVCFAGAGSYDHFIPSVVDALAGKGEFVTAYTPYQAEASQGSLQAFFEFQSMVCRLTGMDIANASLYEGATAMAEAVNMAAAASGKRQVLVSRAVNPDYRFVLRTYVSDLPVQVSEVGMVEGGDGSAPACGEADGRHGGGGGSVAELFGLAGGCGGIGGGRAQGWGGGDPRV